MKTYNTPRETITNSTEKAAFTMKANGKAFKVLINGLYADKPRSITREIWSNAFDAHVAAGKADVPFEVTFPSTFYPVFRVRDFGTGLSHQDIMHLYTTLFESSKEDTDLQVGKLGLGSKSPYAYTDTFAVTSWYKGKKRFYSATMSVEDIPEMHYMGEEDTDEPNGIEVSFPVNSKDINAFAIAAREVAKGFEVKPSVTNKSAFGEWDIPEFITSGTGWKLLRANHGLRVKMGCVIYPVDYAALGDAAAPYADLMGKPFLLEVPIGGAEVTASREALSYGKNEPTTDSIISILSVMASEMVSKGVDAIKSAPSYYDACLAYIDLTDYKSNLPQKVKTDIGATAEYDGRKPVYSFILPNATMNGSFCFLNKQAMGRKTLAYRTWVENDFDVKNKYIIVAEDMSLKIKRPGDRIKNLLTSVNANGIWWVRTEKSKEGAAYFASLLEATDGVPVYFMEDLELPNATSTLLNPTNYYRAQRSPVQARVWTMGRTKHEFQKITLSPQDMVDGGVYVKLDTNMLPEKHFSFRSKANSALAAGVKGADRIIGVPKSMWKKFAEPQWVEFGDAVKAFVDDFPAREASLHRKYVELALTGEEYENIRTFKAVCVDIADKVDNFGKTLLECDVPTHSTYNPRPFAVFSKENDLRREFGYPTLNFDTNDLLKEYDSIRAQFAAKYPLLPHIFKEVRAYSGQVKLPSTLSLDNLHQYVLMCN